MSRPPTDAGVLALLCAAFLATAAGCARPRPIASDSRGCPTWQAGDLSSGGPEISALFAESCTSCHSGPTPAASYDLSSYLGVVGDGSGTTPAAVAGDDHSRLVQKLEPATADSIHAPFSDLASTVAQWVGQCRLEFFDSAIHAGGILNPSDPDFHGNLLRQTGWDFGLCASCHGSDFTGGAAHVACTTCHAAGPTACNTCHGLPPAEGAHATHVDGGVLGKQFACTECHVPPKVWSDPGHLLAADGGVNTAPPSVLFGALAATPETARKGPPAFDGVTQTCSNVYCHGDAFADADATRTRPVWGAIGQGQAACGTCHGLPPSNHDPGSTHCSACHGLVVDANRNFIAPALHIDGKVELGDGSGTCSACHGSAASPAPPPDLEGDTDTTAIGVGAHQSHLQALHRLRGPVACGDCHLVPTAPGDPGHVDHPPPAIVFPTSISGSSLAFADGATPSWDHATLTCSTTYCHGGGSDLANDKSPSLHRTPDWTQVDANQAACGTCHGIPPQDGVGGHGPGTSLSDCVKCHPGTIDANGTILVDADGGSEHIDGVVEHVP